MAGRVCTLAELEAGGMWRVALQSADVSSKADGRRLAPEHDPEPSCLRYPDG